jgi:hypothetical protein
MNEIRLAPSRNKGLFLAQELAMQDTYEARSWELNIAAGCPRDTQESLRI